MKKKGTFLLFILLLSIYIFLFPFPLKKEICLFPVWVKDISHPEIQHEAAEGEAVPFRLGDTFGFVSEKGALSLSESVLYDVAYDEEFLKQGGFVNFSSVSDKLVFRDRRGDFLFTVETYGYPVLMKGRIFVISTERATLAEYDTSGALLWEKGYTSIITSVDATAADIADPLVVVSLLNGKSEVLSRKGSVVFSSETEGSRVSVAYGCGVSSDGQFFAVSRGIDPRRIVVYERKSGQFRKLFEREINERSRRQTGIRFSDDATRILVTGDGVLHFFDLKGNGVDYFFQGRLLGYGYDGEGGLAYTLSSDGGKGGFSLFDPSGFSMWSSTSLISATEKSERSPFTVVKKEFPAGVTVLSKRGRSYYLGIDSKLMRIDREEL